MYASDNHIAAGKTTEKVAADFQALVKVVQQELPRTKIAYISIEPSILRRSLRDKISQANALIEAQGKKVERLLNLDVVKPMRGDDGKPRPERFAKDGLHLNDKGFGLWASIVKAHLK